MYILSSKPSRMRLLWHIYKKEDKYFTWFYYVDHRKQQQRLFILIQHIFCNFTGYNIYYFRAVFIVYTYFLRQTVKKKQLFKLLWVTIKKLITFATAVGDGGVVAVFSPSSAELSLQCKQCYLSSTQGKGVCSILQSHLCQ
jgi:hypothetical protein